MLTPWGNLRDLDLNDLSIAEKIISADKHRLIEGLISECIFDQIFQKVPESSECKVLALDIETIIVDTNNASERWIALVWARTKTEGLGRYLLALEKQFVPYLLEYDKSTGFSAVKRENGRPLAQPEKLEELLSRLSGGAYKTFSVHESVRDDNRQKQAFWGYVSNYYGDRLGHQIILPRLLLNCGVQPYFRGVWNLDRMLLVDDKIWMLEVKHKYPMELPPKGDYPTLRFGINEGELGVIGKVVECGIRCLHTVLVKPFWSTEVGPMYLLSHLASREKVALIAAILDKKAVEKMMAGRSGKAAEHTSINGASKVSYKTLPAGYFKNLGVLTDSPENIARKIVATMKGEPVSSLREEYLQEMRCPIP